MVSQRAVELGVLPVPVLELPQGNAIEPLHSALVVPHLLSEWADIRHFRPLRSAGAGHGPGVAPAGNGVSAAPPPHSIRPLHGPYGAPRPC